MAVSIYRLPPGEVTTPRIRDPRVIVQASVSNIEITRRSNGVEQDTRLAMDAGALIPVDQQVRLQWDEPVEFIRIVVAYDFLLKLEAENLINAEHVAAMERLNFRDPVVTQIAYLLANMLRKEAVETRPDYLDSIARFLVLHLVHNDAISIAGQDSAQPLRVSDMERVAQFIQGNLDKSLRLEQIAKVANLSNFYFLKVFKSAFGKTPHQYVLECRIELAKCLLSKTALPINEISQRCGFSSQSHFTNAFRQNTDTAPRNFRHLNQETGRGNKRFR